jgi:hypothetical protein
LKKWKTRGRQISLWQTTGRIEKGVQMLAAEKEQSQLGRPSDERYEYDDWVQFRSIASLSQLSGVPAELLRRLVAKELADNGLDAGATCCVGAMSDGWFFVEDDGPGIPVEDVGRLFSFRRPLISSKLKRLPTRGALGNGLRVVAGAVFASGGSLRVITRGCILTLTPQQSGETLVRSEPGEKKQERASKCALATPSRTIQIFSNGPKSRF